MKTKALNTQSNESIWEIAEALEQKYDNPLWHRFIGLPGSIGGAIYGNAGCFGLETESNFIHADIYDMLK
jgi:UDP-N-acetylmuramate dehydrogenase